MITFGDTSPPMPTPVSGDQVCASLPPGPSKDQCYALLTRSQNAAMQNENYKQQRRNKMLLWGGGILAAGVAGVLLLRR